MSDSIAILHNIYLVGENHVEVTYKTNHMESRITESVLYIENAGIKMIHSYAYTKRKSAYLNKKPISRHYLVNSLPHSNLINVFYLFPGTTGTFSVVRLRPRGTHLVSDSTFVLT